MILPDCILGVITLIEKNGYEAFAVGGCVRDSLLGRVPEDWDIATSATPEKILKIFSEFQTVPTGIKHGTITVFVKGEPIEITTYRIDGNYKDHRRPESVSFSSKLSDDLRRRDFTINAMAYHPKYGIVDLFDGTADLESKTIRCVGNAKKRFCEDSLRIMRALRFSAVLGFDIESQTATEVKRCSGLLKSIANERICAEFSKLINSKKPQSVLFDYKDVFSVILDVPPTVLTSVWFKNCKAVSRSNQILSLRLALILNGLPIKNILKNLKYPNNIINSVTTVSEWMNSDLSEDRTKIKKTLSKIGAANFELVLEAKHAMDDKTAKIDRIRQALRDIIASDECYTLKGLAVNGNDLINTFGLKGNEIKTALNQLLDAVICGNCINEQNALLDFAKRFV